MSKSGTLKTFNNAKGFGYITPDDLSEDVFFHLQAVSGGTEFDMIPGAKLTFEVGINSTNGMMKAVQVFLQAPGVPATPQEVQEFLLLNPVEEKAQLKFMQMDPMLQRMVINRGSLAGARDATAAFIGRMVSIERATKSMPAMPALPADVQNMKTGTIKTFNNAKGFGYIAPDDFSEDVFFHLQAVSNGSEFDMIPGAKLRFEVGVNNMNGKTKAVRIHLDAPGALGMGNPLMAMASSYGKAASGGQFHGGNPYGADPMAAMMAAMTGMFGQQAQTAGHGGVEPASQQEVQEFLMMNPVEPHAVQKFMLMDPQLQRMVINRGSLAGARDSTAAFIGRMVSIEKAARGQF